MTELCMSATADENLTLLSIKGDVNAVTVGRLLQCGIGYLLGPGDALAVDLAQVTSIDAVGVDALLQVGGVAAQVGRKLVFLKPPPSVRQILTTCGLDRAFEYVDDVSNDIET
jgi:anti-anti-sigma factor